MDRFSDFLVRDSQDDKKFFRADKLLEAGRQMFDVEPKQIVAQKTFGSTLKSSLRCVSYRFDSSSWPGCDGSEDEGEGGVRGEDQGVHAGEALFLSAFEAREARFSCVRNQADAYSQAEITEIFKKYDVRSPEVPSKGLRHERYAVGQQADGSGAFQSHAWHLKSGIEGDFEAFWPWLKAETELNLLRSREVPNAHRTGGSHPGLPATRDRSRHLLELQVLPGAEREPTTLRCGAGLAVSAMCYVARHGLSRRVARASGTRSRHGRGSRDSASLRRRTESTESTSVVGLEIGGDRVVRKADGQANEEVRGLLRAF